MAMSAARGGGMLPTNRRKPLLRTFISLYRSEFAFQGMVDFFVIGLVVMLFLHPPSAGQLRSLLSGIGIGTKDAQPNAVATAPVPAGPSGASQPTKQSQASSPPAKPASPGAQAPQGQQTSVTPPSKPLVFPAEIARPSLANVMLLEIGETAFRNSHATDQQRLLAARAAYRNGRGAEIVDILKEADGRDPNVAFMRGLGLLIHGDEASGKASEEALRTAAAAHHTLAEVLLGRVLITAPKGITKNVEEGQRLIEAAAASGDPQAKRVAAIAYMSAEFGSFQPDRAASLFKEAAEAGDPQAMFHYAHILSEGIGVSADRAAAMDFLGRAAATGLTSAQIMLADVLMDQYKAKTLNDPADAVSWYERAMQKGHSWFALNRLQALYGWDGRDAPWNDKGRYFELAKQCSGLADTFCQYSNSIVYQNGWGTAKDAFRAYVFALIARDLGHPSVKAETVDNLGNALTAKERADAAEKARSQRQKLKPAPALVVFQYPDAARPSPWASIEDVENSASAQPSQPVQPAPAAVAGSFEFDEYMSKPSGFYYWRIAFDPAEFNTRPPQLRNALQAALAAYRNKQASGIIDALKNADANDPTVNLLKGIATLRLSDDPADAQVRGQLEAESARYLRAAANAGDVKAMAILGSLQTMKLQGIPQNLQDASRLAEQAAQSNDAFAVRQLAIGVLSGTFGSAPNPTRAADLMWTAAELGDPAANAMIAAFFHNGTGVPADAEKAEKYLRRAADLGYTDAQRVLAAWIVDQYKNKQIASPAEGARLLEKAATSGRSLWSARQLALLYGDVGREPPWKDRPKGLEIAQACAPYSYAACHFTIGAYLAGGSGVTANRVKSWAHYNIARELGYTDAVARLEKLEKSMTTKEIDSARSLSQATMRDLKPTPSNIEIQEANASPAARSTAPAASAFPSNYADEMTDWGVRPQTNLKYDVGSKTPITIPGARRITTQELEELRSQALVIDVLDERTGHYTIPGAIHLPGAGNYGNGRFEGGLQDTFQTVLSGLVRLNPNRPIVFFCASSQCWESYNAALRAMKLGFRNVLWYRGGLLSWKAANQPVTPPTEVYPVR